MLDHPSAAFLATLFGPSGPPDGTFAQLWDASRAFTHNLTSWNQAAAVVSVGRTKDVYVSAGLSSKNTGHSTRMKQSECAGIPGCWLDVDVVGGPTNRSSGAPDKGAAAGLAGQILEPTLLVDSGYGVQAWWLLPEPWMFSGDDERDAARRLEAGAVGAHRGLAPWKVDSVHDLARLMRLPGTTNGKDKRHPVGVEILHEGPRYDVARLREAFGEGSFASTNGASSELQLDFELGQVGLDPLKFAALCSESPRFNAVFHERWDDQTALRWSASECDLSLASTAAAAGWPDLDIAALIYAHRTAHHPDSVDKALRRDYVERTISRARSDSKMDARRRAAAETRERENAHREAALAQLADQASEPEPAPEAAPEERRRRIELLNEVVFGNVTGQYFTRLLQHGRDADARYTLITEGGVEVDVGTARTLLNPDRFRETLAPALNHVMPGVKRADWLAALRALVQMAEVVEHQDESPRGALRSALAEYVHAHQWVADRDEDEAKISGLPVLNGKTVMVSIGPFLDWSKRRDRVPKSTSVNAVARDLQALGMERVRAQARRPDGSLARPWYYQGPSGVLDP